MINKTYKYKYNLQITLQNVYDIKLTNHSTEYVYDK